MIGEKNNMETIENILAIIGLVSLILTVIRVIWVFFGSGTEWIDNINVTERPYDPKDEECEDGTGIYPTYFKDDADRLSYATATFITPQSTIIRKLKIKQVNDKSLEKGKFKYKTVKTIKVVTPQRPLCVICERAETIPKYCIQWRVDYGGKATYYFSENLRDGNNDCKGIEYYFGFFSKIRKLLDLK